MLLNAAPDTKDETQTLIDTARSLPPEFGSDALLRLAGSERVPEKERKQDLYETVFQLAGAVRVDGPRKLAYPLPDSAERFSGLAAGLGLDRMTLQLRAVTGILRDRPARARELFAQIMPPAPVKLVCADALVPDPSAYYELLPKILERSYSPEEKAKQEPVRLLLAAVQSATTSVQLAPLGKLLLGYRMTDQQRELLLSAFAARLGEVNDDDRTYTYAVGELQLSKHVNALIEQAGGATAALTDAWTAFVKRQEKGPRCQGVLRVDSVAMPGGGTMNAASSIDPNEKLPSKPALALKVTVYPLHPEAQKLTERVRGLWINERGLLVSAEERAATEWQSKAVDALSAIDGWQPATSSESADGFHEKLALYRGLLQSGVGAELHERVLQSYVAALCGSSVQTERPAEWLVELNILFDLVRTPKGVPNSNAMRGAIIRELTRGQNPVAAAYGALEGQSPAGIGEWRGLGGGSAK